MNRFVLCAMVFGFLSSLWLFVFSGNFLGVVVGFVLSVESFALWVFSSPLFEVVS